MRQNRAPCRAYGCNWSKNLAETLRAPDGYVVEKCEWCGETKTVYEYL